MAVLYVNYQDNRKGGNKFLLWPCRPSYHSNILGFLADSELARLTIREEASGFLIEDDSTISVFRSALPLARARTKLKKSQKNLKRNHAGNSKGSHRHSPPDSRCSNFGISLKRKEGIVLMSSFC